MTRSRETPPHRSHRIPEKNKLESSHYALLGLHPSASPLEIRRAYRDLSKRYHPDTTDLPAKTATAKFQELNEAYATLSNPERRTAYDGKIGYSRMSVIQPPANLNRPTGVAESKYSSNAYLDPSDRPLSAGEICVLFVLGLTLVGCLLLAIAIGLTRGEAAFQVSVPPALLTHPFFITLPYDVAFFRYPLI